MDVFIFNQTNLKTQITDLKIDLLIIKSYKKRGVVTMYCKQCGNFIDENKDQFCMNCGMPVNQEQVQQIKQENEKKEGKVIYYVSEVLSLFFIVAFLVNALNENIEAVSDLCYAFAMINLHKILKDKYFLV